MSITITKSDIGRSVHLRCGDVAEIVYVNDKIAQYQHGHAVRSCKLNGSWSFDNPNIPSCYDIISFYGSQVDESYEVADEVNNPAHYTAGDIECIDAIKAQLTPEEFRGYCKGNIAKYVWRERHKQGRTALEKAQWYLNKLLEVIE